MGERLIAPGWHKTGCPAAPPASWNSCQSQVSERVMNEGLNMEQFVRVCLHVGC